VAVRIRRHSDPIEPDQSLTPVDAGGFGIPGALKAVRQSHEPTGDLSSSREGLGLDTRLEEGVPLCRRQCGARACLCEEDTHQ